MLVVDGEVGANCEGGETVVAPGRLMLRSEAVFVVRGEHLGLRGPR